MNCCSSRRLLAWPDGLGLGLSICRELVETHNGRLAVASGATGGTVFVIKLPTAVE